MKSGRKTLCIDEPPSGDGRIKKPTSQARARDIYKAGKSWHYTPGSTVKVRALIAEKWAAEHGVDRREGPIGMAILVLFPRPKSHFTNKPHPHELKENMPIYPTVKPDFDNLEKLVADALQGVAFLDDSQIVQTTFQKQYIDIPWLSGRWEITLWELGEDGISR